MNEDTQSIEKGGKKTCVPSIFTLEDYKSYITPKKFRRKPKQFLYKYDIIFTLNQLKIPYSKTSKKNQIQSILFKFYESMLNYYNEDNLKKIIFIQRLFKNYKNKQFLKLYGPGFLDKSKCNNNEDCYTLESLHDIEDKYFFSFYDNTNFIYFFDIRTFKKIIEQDAVNPYNRTPIPQHAIDLYYKRLEWISKKNIIIDPYEIETELTPEQKFNDQVLEIFQTIDTLNAMAGGTNVNWFHNLSIQQLRKYYQILEDIWNYRAELTTQQKTDIVLNNQMFKIKIPFILCMTDKRKLQNIILNEMKKLITSSENPIHRSTGAYYILIAFTEVSQECASEMPWLIQY